MRRQYMQQGSTPKLGESHTSDMTPYDPDLDWDEEAIEEARAQANVVEEHDAEAARNLRRQADAAEQKLYRSTHSPSPHPMSAQNVYDPMRLYARMGKLYPWMSKHAIDTMHYPTFFAYVREANIADQEEKDAYEREKHKGRYNTHTSTPHEVQQYVHEHFPQAQTYGGEVVNYG